MFDVTGGDIALLADDDLRTLIARLALAELRASGAPQSAVTAGGHQDAGDGGIDVRVAQETVHAGADFVPRAMVGFQVKKPDMPASAIRDEMRPEGVLRPVISDLAARGGAYIIVSAQGSVADAPLAARSAAMRAAVNDDPNGADLALDFYDRARVATWVNRYPGVAAWVRERCGRRLAGWRPVGTWRDTLTSPDKGYLADDGLTLLDERDGRRVLPVLEGIDVLRGALSKPTGCVRLIGMSGVGKTRLVQALFEQGVGNSPLDPGLAVYADYTEPTDPTARDMAEALYDRGERAILVVDNCNVTTHGQLVEIAGRQGSPLSVLTVEYDIRDDEPEGTDVFRLDQSAPGLIQTWLARDFPNVSQVDRSTIATFSGGNFRVARALAGTVRPGESLGRLRSQELFERIFQQRNAPDDVLLRDAQAFALVYSFDVSDEGGELAAIATLTERPVMALREAILTLQDRGVMQARGRWRAVLPQAIANPLAAGLLRRTPVDTLDAFVAGLPMRMVQSLTRRIGYLHDAPDAVAAAERWIAAGGPLSDLTSPAGIGLLVNLAPTTPEAALRRLTDAFEEERAPAAPQPRTVGRGSWISLLKALAYDPAQFDRAAWALATMVASESPEENYDNARSAFQELFQLHLSGTQAPPSQRRALIRRLLAAPDEGLRRAGRVALEALMQAGHFSSISNLDFGARPRDFGWGPQVRGDVDDWYLQGVRLILEAVEDPQLQRRLIAEALRGLWSSTAYRAEIVDVVVPAFEAAGGWREGWSALKTVMAFDREDMPEAVRAVTEALIARLAPSDLLARARSFVIVAAPGSWDAWDEEDLEGTWKQAEQIAEAIGRDMASEPDLLDTFLAELMQSLDFANRTGAFAEGLVAGSPDLPGLWRRVVDIAVGLDPATRNLAVLGGVVQAAARRSPDLVTQWLEESLVHPGLTDLYAGLQVNAGLDAAGVERVLRVAEGAGSARAVQAIGRADTTALAQDLVLRMIERLAALEGGVVLGLEMLFNRARRLNNDEALPQPFVEAGRSLLFRLDLADLDDIRDLYLRVLAPHCLAGEEGREAARRVAEAVHAAFSGHEGYRRRGQSLVEALFDLQPIVALDVFVGGGTKPAGALFDARMGRRPLVERIDMAVVVEWAQADPGFRFARLSRVMKLFKAEPGSDAPSLSESFITVLQAAPDKAAFLGEPYWRLRPSSGWAGTFVHVLEQRQALLDGLPDDPDIRGWTARAVAEAAAWIRHEQERQGESEERFE